MINMTMQVKFEVEEAEQVKKLEVILKFLTENGGELVRLDNYKLNTGLIGTALGTSTAQQARL